MQSKTNELKKRVFHEMLDLAGRVFVVARYSENVIIGNRGFTEDEKKNGIVLIFNASMNFSWDDPGISSALVFGTSPQKCFIPADDIVAIYSPELKSQFITALPPRAETADEQDKAAAEAGEEEAGSKVVKVDFTKKRTSRKTKSAISEESSHHES
jgi:hypothetical protein